MWCAALFSHLEMGTENGLRKMKLIHQNRHSSQTARFSTAVVLSYIGLLLIQTQTGLSMARGITEEGQELTNHYQNQNGDKIPWANLHRSLDTTAKSETKFLKKGNFSHNDGGGDDTGYSGDTGGSIWSSDYDDEGSKDNQNNQSLGPGRLGPGVGPSNVMSKEAETITTNCQCGYKRGSSGKIVGGTLAHEHAWPWMAAVVYIADDVPRQFCGGSLINNWYILTAAHCVQDMGSAGLEKFRIYVGTNAINGINSTATAFQIHSLIPHPSFNKLTLNNDIALIRLTAPVVYKETVMPICLGQSGAPHSGRAATIAGWGSISSATTTVNDLRNVEVKIIPNGSCASSYAKVKIQITQFMMCASSPDKDACKGDSGGPLFVKRNRNTAIYDQIGVVSFGQDCGKPEYPGVYARIARYMKFIRENTKDATYCTLSFDKL